MLLLKLTMVPLALLLFGIVERRHGPRVAGWISGFPIVAFPLLVLITLDLGPAFASAAALGAYFGLVPWLAFTMSYAWLAGRMRWPATTLISFSIWMVLTLGAVVLQKGPVWLEILPAAAFVAALWVYPRGEPSDEEREHVWWGVPSRMIAGALLTLVITQFASRMGTQWSGIFTTFPVMGSIIAISSHIQYGKHAVQEAVAGMTMGVVSAGAFCFAAYVFLGSMGNVSAFALSLAVSSSVHALTWLLFKNPRQFKI